MSSTFSDDDITEGLGRQIPSGALRDFAGTAWRSTRSSIHWGCPPAVISAMGAALSRSDALAPATLTALLRLAVLGKQPQLRTLLSAMAIAGFTGTLAVV